MKNIFEVLRNITCGILMSEVVREKREFQIFPSIYLANKIDMDETKRQLIVDFEPYYGDKLTLTGKTMFSGLFDNLPLYN